MSVDKAREYLKKYDRDKDIIISDKDTSTVHNAALALGVKEGNIAKTMSFDLKGKYILVLIAGDKKVDNAKYKSEFNTKAHMIPYDEVEKIVGHAPGGVCPFGINDGIDVYLDESLKEYEFIYPACGSSNSAIKLTNEELHNVSGAIKYVDISK